MISSIRIAVAIPTFQRPQRLAILLDALPARLAELEADCSAEVFVIDNDPGRSAERVAQSAAGVVYSAEPAPGIAAARQHALDAAADFDLLAFIDDDELPQPLWLRALVSTWRRTGAAAVAGHVHTEFPAGTDPWVLASGLFARRRRADGEPLPAAGAGNLLIDLAQIRRSGIGFDASLGLGGGEDTLFTRMIVRAGGQVVACPASVAVDVLETGRATRRFALARARHHGRTQSIVESRLATGRVAMVVSCIRNLVKGCAWMARGMLRWTSGTLPPSMPRRAVGAREIQRGIGLIQGAMGGGAPEYGRSPQHRRAPSAILRRAARGLSPLFRSVVGVHTRLSQVVLTLDDGPDPEWTPRILDLLADRGATATFFVLLTRTRQYPELLRRIVAEGHEVALHGADHRRLTSYSGTAAEKMLRDSRAELEQYTGARVRWYRPPYGALSMVVWLAARRAGLTPVLWTTSVLDGRDAPHAQRLMRATRDIRPGAIILAHDSRAGEQDGVSDPVIAPIDRVALLAEVIDEYDRRGLRPVSLAQALRTGRTRQRMVLVR
ncbi:polysaccharide deacetylase family protein [Microbacterium sp.]|uniref:polysaccharide deacetylase family protein n=1 Tax=Microbacterium sp. TaxID=51671 RepID=UPI003A951E9A